MIMHNRSHSLYLIPLLGLFFLLLLSLPCKAQKGWRFNPVAGFKVKSQSYFERNNISSFKIYSSDSVWVGGVSFNENYLIDTLVSLDTLITFFYDSIDNCVLEAKHYPVSLPHQTRGTHFVQKENCYRYMSVFLDSFVVKTFRVGSLINNQNEVINEKYHREKFIDPATGKKVKPLRKKLPTNYEPDRLYYTNRYRMDVRDSVWIDEGITPEEQFILPAFITKNLPPENVPFPFQKHMHVAFNKDGFISKIWFDEEEQYRIGYRFF